MNVVSTATLVASALAATLVSASGCDVSPCRQECYQVCDTFCNLFGCWQECYTECYCVATVVVECTSNRDCATGSICSGGDCVSVNTGNKGLCETCTAHASCLEQGALCVTLPGGSTRVCGRACREDTDCPSAFSCSDVAGSSQDQCLPTSGTCGSVDAGCLSSAQCAAGQLCDKGRCVADPGACSDDGQCAVNQMCASGACVPRGCDNNDGCNAGQVCLDKGCHATCLATSHCPLGRVCSGGVCTPEDRVECRQPGDCDDGKVCANATCKPACTENTACPTGFICKQTFCDVDPSTPRTCTTAAQCLVGEACAAGTCTLK